MHAVFVKSYKPFDATSLVSLKLTSEVASKLKKSGLICALLATCQKISDLHLFEPDVPEFG